MQAAGEVVARMLAATRAAAAPGVRLRELDDIARTVLDEAGAGAPFLHYQPHPGMPPYPGVICTSVNDVALHGIPTERRLAEGDLLSIDAGASLDGWVGDSAISLTVGPGRDEDHALDKTAEQALRAGQIIRRLRDFVARGETETRVEPVARLIEEASALALVGAKEHGVRVRFRYDRGVDLVLADKVQVQQVLLNLIRNAIDAMEGSPTKELTVAVQRGEDGQADGHVDQEDPPPADRGHQQTADRRSRG